MTTAVIETQADLQKLYDQVQQRFEGLRFEDPLTLELRSLEQLHAGFFREQRAPNDSPWAPLRPSTIKRKGHATILQDKRRLIASLTNPAGPDVLRDVVDQPAGKGLSFGSYVEYSGAHDKAQGNRPARRHVGFSDIYLNNASGRIANFAVKGLKDES